jgi:hypothetical protein
MWARCWRIKVASGASILSVEAMKGWNDSWWVLQCLCISVSWHSLVVEVFSLGLGICRRAVKVGEHNIYNCIGSTFKESANGDVASFLSVDGCGYLIGGLCWGISCGGCRVVVNGLSSREDFESGSVGMDWLDGDGYGGNISEAMAPSSWQISR